MCKECIRFRGEASHHLGFPKTTRVVLSSPKSNVNVAELQLDGVRPEDVNGKTIVIDVELPKLSESKISVLRREDPVGTEKARARQREFMASCRDQFD